MDTQQLDKIFWHWAEQVAARYDTVDSPQDVADNFAVPPSDWLQTDPYFSEIEFILDRSEYDFPEIPCPLELIAANLSDWAENEVPVTHPLVQNASHWHTVAIDMGFDSATPADAKQLYILVRGIAKRPELVKNLGNWSDFKEHTERPKVVRSEGVKIVRIPDDTSPEEFMTRDYIFAVLGVEINGQEEELVAFVDAHSQDARLYSLDGKPIPVESDGIVQFMLTAPKSMIQMEELASVIGNHLASLVVGEDGIGLFDLPYD